MRISHRLLLVLAIVAMPGLALVGYNAHATRQARTAEVAELATRMLAQVRGEQARVVDGLRQVLVTMSESNYARERDFVRCGEVLRRLRPRFSDYLSFHVTDADNIVRCSTDESALGVDLKGRSHVVRARESGEFAVGQYFVRAGNKTSLGFGLPYRDEEGRVAGVMTAVLDIGWFTDFVAEWPLLPHAAIAAIDTRGVVIARAPSLPEVIGGPMREQHRWMLQAEREGVVEMQGLDGANHLVAYSPPNDGALPGLLVTICLNKERALASVSRSSHVMAVGLGLLLLLGALLAWWVGERFIGRPIASLREAVWRWRSGDLAARATDFESTTEIAALARSFNAMAAALQRAHADNGALVDELREREAQLLALADSLPQLVWVARPDGQLYWYNRRCYEYSGAAEAELDGAGWAAVIHPDDLARTSEAWAHAVATGTHFEIELRVRDRHGAYRWFISRAVPVREHGRIIRWFGTSTDIDTQRRTAEALRAAKEEAEAANLSKSKFLAAASHDLRQPMQSLFLFAAALGRHVEDDTGKRALDVLQQSLATLKALLDSLLDISRLDAGKIVPQIETFALGEVLGQIGEAYVPVAAAKGLRLSFCGECAMMVRSDKTLLGRMLRNLVENAIRYTREGDVRIACRVQGDALWIDVEDSGIGIPADHLGRIFEEFHQVDNSERDREQGLGLGLAIVRHLSKLLDHEVRVQSTRGRGSTFSVHVPLGVGIVATAAPAQPFGVAPDGHGRLALVVEDENTVLMGLRATLIDWGYEVVAASDLRQALSEVDRLGRQPDVILADYRLRQGVTGTDVICAVRHRFEAPIPSIVLTGEVGGACRREATEHGFRLLQKPISLEQLGDALEAQQRAAA